MTSAWRVPKIFMAHELLGALPLGVMLASSPEALPSRTVEQIFNDGLLGDVVLGPRGEVNSRIDKAFDNFRDQLSLQRPTDLEIWGNLGRVANRRRSQRAPILGQNERVTGELLNSPQGRFLLRQLPFVNRERRNDTHDILYFRDSGIHRRLIERTLNLDHDARRDRDGDFMDLVREQRLRDEEFRRWEAFVVNTILDCVGERCAAFAYRHEESREIDLILEWNDRSSPEPWAIEICGSKFNTHPKPGFFEECKFLGVDPGNAFVVRRANDCDSGARGRCGVPALSLPAMIDHLKQRMLR